MLDVALKEWSIVCDLLLEGRLAMLLRKGGIHETAGPGVFELEHERFALFPSWAHQNPGSIKAPWQADAQKQDEPETITIQGLATVAAVHPVQHRDQLDALNDLHCWTPAYLDMRWHYKPERPLYLIAVRGYRLVNPTMIPNHPEYAGCRSWVPLRPTDHIDDTNSTPAMPDAEFFPYLARITSQLTL